MKKNNINIILILASVIVLFGCKKFLDTLPDNRIDLDDPANITVDKVSALLVNAYPKANYIPFCEAMSDNSDDKTSGSAATSNVVPYQWADANNSHAQDMPTTYWDEAYKSIALANQALVAIGKVNNPQTFKAQKGEALVARAYAHFMLVNLFSRTYDLATANSDPGIPYVTSLETVVFGKYERKTVAYTYDAIRKDLLEGLPLISDDAYTVPKYHFTKAAANAFAARFYLFKHDYDSAAIFASKVIGNAAVGTLMRPWLTTYRDKTYNELLQLYTSPSEKANLLLVETVSNWAQYPFYRFGLTSDLNQKIFGKAMGGKFAYRMAGAQQYLNLPKFYNHFVQNGLNANSGLYYTTIPLFSIEEVLLNRAEAYAQSGRFNDAIADLNSFAQGRIFIDYDNKGVPIRYNPGATIVTMDTINKYYPTGDIKTKIVQAVLGYKRAEFTFEGMRWFDILRHKIEVTHKLPAYMVSGSSSPFKDTTIVLTVNDKRRLLQLPDAAMLSGIPLNPRDN